MGAVVSCVRSLPLHLHLYMNVQILTKKQIAGVFRSIGACLMGIVHAIGSICMAIINGVVSLFDVIITCLTCGYCGGRRRRGGVRRSRI